MLNFIFLHPQANVDHLGLLPELVSGADPRPARDQFAENYAYGGGWRPMKGWEHEGNGVLTYPGDNPLYPIAEAKLRDETIRVYESAWVAIFQPDGSFEISRMD